MDQIEAIDAINAKYPQMNAHPAVAFYGKNSEAMNSEGGIWFRQEGAEIDGMRVHDEWHESPNLYHITTLQVFEDFLESLGYYSEPYDCGTLMAWPIDPDS